VPSKVHKGQKPQILSRFSAKLQPCYVLNAVISQWGGIENNIVSVTSLIIIGSKTLYCKCFIVMAKTVFTRSAITPPKVNRFGRNLEQCEPNAGGGLALAVFGRDPRSSDSFRWIVFLKNAKPAHKISRSCDFRPS